MLRPCRACNRHLHEYESRCPFCDAHVPLAGVPVLRAPSPRLSRAAQLAFYVTLTGASSAHCAGNVADPDSPVPLSTPDAGAPDALTEATMAQQNIAPQDAGSDAAARPSMIAIYGDPSIRITSQIHFPLSKATAGEEESSLLRAIAEVLREHHFIVEIEGHADPAEKQSGISLRRAKHVRDRLVQLRVDPAQLKVVDRAATQPIAPTPAKLNARVSFRVIDGPAENR